MTIEQDFIPDQQLLSRINQEASLFRRAVAEVLASERGLTVRPEDLPLVFFRDNEIARKISENVPKDVMPIVFKSQTTLLGLFLEAGYVDPSFLAKAAQEIFQKCHWTSLQDASILREKYGYIEEDPRELIINHTSALIRREITCGQLTAVEPPSTASIIRRLAQLRSERA